MVTPILGGHMKRVIDNFLRVVERAIYRESQHKGENRVLQEERFTGSEIKVLSINTEALDVEIKQSVDAECVLSIETNDLRDRADDVSIEAKIAGNSIQVSSVERNFYGAKLMVLLPCHYDSVKVVAVDGDVAVSDCQIGQVAIVTRSSDITVKKIVCDEMNLASENGDVLIIDVNSKKQICAKSVTGDVVQ